MANITTYTYPLSGGIKTTKEFAKKKLADFAVNVGVKCAHDCTYCSTGAMLRMHGAGLQEASQKSICLGLLDH